MSAIEQDLMKLYSERILALAAGISHLGRLDDAHGSATRRSPLCGSTVTIDVRMDGGRIADLAQDVKACALGQASASVMAADAVGRTRDEIARGREALTALIKQDGPIPGAPFEDLENLRPARDYKNRHASILLAWDAALAAIDAADSGAG
ncbi:MAG: iron-sulfur cluster assembly scaffold protein [Pseudomonadota bacterium]